jgi:MYXO-CTERM domain-containing protein
MMRLFVCLCALLCTSEARAFSDPFSFSITPIVAGGGGRFFTGAPGDGYTCKSCHSGGTSPKVNVLGLPVSGYKPGTRYEISIRWPEPFTKVSLALELTDAQGKAAGSLRVPPLEETQEDEFCEPASEQVPAATLNDLTEGKQVINMPDCGAKSLRFLWTAPATDVGQVWFAGSMVLSDGESDPYHDGVTDFGRVLGSPATLSETTGSCSVTRASGSSGLGLLPLLAAAAFIRLRSASKRRTYQRARCSR